MRPTALYTIPAASLALAGIPYTFTSFSAAMLVAALLCITGYIAYSLIFLRNRKNEGYLGPKLFAYVKKTNLHCQYDNRCIHMANQINDFNHPVFVEIMGDLLDEWYRDNCLTSERATYYTEQLEILRDELALQANIKRQMNVQSKKKVNYSENLKYETEQLKVALTASTDGVKLLS